MERDDPRPVEADDNPGAGELSLELVGRIRSGDSDAWNALYLRYRDRLLFSIRCRLGTQLRARLQSEDILHSVVKDVMEDLARFEHRGEGSLERFLHTCVLNKIRSKAEYFGAKKRSGDVALSEAILARLPASADEEPGYMDAERFGKLEQALRQLPEPMREIVLLRRIENLSNAEAARELEKSPEAASKLFNRALARLAVHMTP